MDEVIYALAQRSFGVEKHWHKRIVRSGPNTVRIFAENPPVREIAAGDTIFLDLGVFDEWEADVGRTYVMGHDPDRQRLCQDLPRIFDDSSSISTTIAMSRAPNFMHTPSNVRKRPAGCSAVRSPGISLANSLTRIAGDKDLLSDQPLEPRTDARPGRSRANEALDHRGTLGRPCPNFRRVLRTASATSEHGHGLTASIGEAQPGADNQRRAPHLPERRRSTPPRPAAGAHRQHR